MPILVLLAGCVIGSVYPAYILGRFLSGIDIRQQGTGNAGTRNVYAVLGLWPAVATAVFDLSKGFLAILSFGLWHTAGFLPISSSPWHRSSPSSYSSPGPANPRASSPCPARSFSCA